MVRKHSGELTAFQQWQEAKRTPRVREWVRFITDIHKELEFQYERYNLAVAPRDVVHDRYTRLHRLTSKIIPYDGTCAPCLYEDDFVAVALVVRQPWREGQVETYAIVITDADDWILERGFHTHDEAREFYLRLPSIITDDWIWSSRFEAW